MERPVFIEECGEEMGLISLISNLYSGLCFTTLIRLLTLLNYPKEIKYGKGVGSCGEFLFLLLPDSTTI